MSPSNILFEDQHLLVLNKPAGLSAESGNLAYPSAEKETLALLHARGLRAPYLRCVHRLDRPASGILLMAKTKLALSHLMRQFEQHQVQKIYWAMTENKPAASEGLLENWLKKDESGRKSLVLEQNGEGAQLARLYYNILKVNDIGLVWQIRPTTGRFHQIRAQLAHIGCPIIGDTTYGGPAWQPFQIKLHAQALAFLHPLTGQKMQLECLPQEWI